MDTETEFCFGSNEADVSALVDALAKAINASELSLDWAPNADTIYLGWHGYGDSEAWVHCSCGAAARNLAKSVAVFLAKPLSLYEAACATTNDTGELRFQAYTISAEGKVMPASATALDGENLEAITAGFGRDRVSQLLGLLKCCNAEPAISHSFKLFPRGDARSEPSAKATIIRGNRVQEILSELELGLSATLARYDADNYEFVIQTAAGYPSTIYSSAAEKQAVEAALTDEIKTKIGIQTVHGPLHRNA